MGRLLQTLLSPRAAPVLGVAVLVLAIFLVGNFCGVDVLWLGIAAGAVVLVSFVALLLKKQKAQKAAGALEAALKAQGQSQAASTRPDQRASIDELKSTFDESLELLRKSKMGREALHSIPYYMLIGPPGSGKSTLLRQSGLSFPYMTKGRSAIRGLGGTKNCDWWFADRGILLDTAGRYTSELDDRDEWMAFLRLLKRGRGKRPINGVVVAMGLAELVESTDSELTLHAENVRDRIDELTRELQTVFPIYVVFTKCDRLRGFVETFDTLNKDQRRQVWGFTFPFDRPREFAVAEQFGNEFDDLYRSLVIRRVDLLASDHFKKRKAQVYAFPLQFLRLKERLQGFLGQLQQANPYQEVSPVRGIYFTSGTQEGTTIDRILKVLRPAELELDVPEDSRRCYFVDDLFNKVVFDDAALAKPTVQAQKKDKLLRRVGITALAVVALAVVFFRWGAWSAFADAASKIEAQAAAASDSQKLREALDAQREMIDSRNVHLLRNGSQPALEAWYGRKLVEYAQQKLNDYADGQARAIGETLNLKAGEKMDDPAVHQRFTEGDARLRTIENGLSALLSRQPEDRTAAQTLWDLALEPSETSRKHLDWLFTVTKPAFVFVAIDNSVRTTREKLRDSLAAGDRSDLDKAAAEGFDKFFASAWQHLQDSKTKFGALRDLDTRFWSTAALGVEVGGPLFAKKSVEAGKPTVEQLFEKLDKDVEVAKARIGAVTQKPLVGMANGGWEQTVAKKKRDFLTEADSVFDRGWQSLLDGLRAVADADAEAKGEEKTGHERVDVLPQLVAAHHLARATMDAGRALTEDENTAAKDRAPKVKHEPGSPPWLKNADDDVSLAASVKRAEQAEKFLGRENDRIADQKWETPLLNQRLRDLESALVEASCRREWKACRDNLQKFAREGPWKSWNQMLAAFPFAPMSGRDATAMEMMTAARQMAELAETLAKLRPRAAFELHPEFAADLDAAQELRQILYPGGTIGEKTVIEARLQIQATGRIADVRVGGTGTDDATGPSPEHHRCVMGGLDSVELQINLNEDGGKFSLLDLVVPRMTSVPRDWLDHQNLVTGPWGLKRLFLLGETKPETSSDKAYVCVLRVRGRPDSEFVSLHIKTTRPEAAVVFDANWPGDRYKLSDRMWKKEQ